MHTTRDREQKTTTFTYVTLRGVLYIHFHIHNKREYVHARRRVEYGAKCTVCAHCLRRLEFKKWPTEYTKMNK